MPLRLRHQPGQPAIPASPSSTWAGAPVLLIYTATMFISAALLFMMQPMFARMVLPLLGGSPAVWNTTVVFYQMLLLAGYVYAHIMTTWLSRRWQVALHMALLLVPLAALPIAIPASWSPPTAENPIPWLLALLLVAVGAPFFVVSASSPLLQSWFAGTRHRVAPDPYFLYAASNAGSMLALVSYPLLIEPELRLNQQSRLWTSGYILLVLLMLACAALVWHASRWPVAADPSRQPGDHRPATTGPIRTSIRRRLRWALLAAVPSSLMLSVTTYLSTNIAPIPLLWIVPLALYLLTFILAFAGRPLLSHTVMSRALPMVLLLLAIVICAQATQPIGMLLLLHLLTFVVVAMVCHGELAADRPPAQQLTSFYLWIAAGGALGGMFNVLLAPLLFTTVVEYPLALVLACLLLRPEALIGGPSQPTANSMPGAVATAPAGLNTFRPLLLDIALSLGLGALVATLLLATRAAGLRPGPLSYGLVFGLPALLCFSFSRRPRRFALAVAAFFAAGALYTSDQGQVLHAERSFFGIHRVLRDPSGQFHIIAHGGTLHGRQSLDPARSREPLSYYTAGGPIGQVFAAGARQRVAVVGLGAGSLACYYRPGQEWTFYEIDPSVERIARDPAYFTFLRDCAPDTSVVLGDARLALARASGSNYDLIVLDAYSSDSTPIHLLTREALALYRDRLAPGGMLAFHISNQYLDLKLVLTALARDAGMVSLYQDDRVVSLDEVARGKNASQWVIMAPERANFGALADDPRWQLLDVPPDAAVWTDDFSSILSVLRWR
ncbi:MAG: spermidine synthase [Roseiflexaceae bacterium]